MNSPYCKCGNQRASGHRYCLSCKSEYMKEWRKDHKLNKDQRFKNNARRYLRVYVKRGTIKRQPCSVCGCESSEAHHEDYSKPLDVIWFCRKHHLEYHRNLKIAA